MIDKLQDSSKKLVKVWFFSVLMSIIIIVSALMFAITGTMENKLIENSKILLGITLIGILCIVVAFVFEIIYIIKVKTVCKEINIRDEGQDLVNIANRQESRMNWIIGLKVFEGFLFLLSSYASSVLGFIVFVIFIATICLKVAFYREYKRLNIS